MSWRDLFDLAVVTLTYKSYRGCILESVRCMQLIHHVQRLGDHDLTYDLAVVTLTFNILSG